jgi:Cu+-exporting ATPase
MEAGGVVLMKNTMHDVITAFKLSKATVGKIKQNMFFALLYNTLGIPIAGGVLVGFGLTLKPEFAGLAMAMSSVSVVLNSLLLKFFHPKRKNWLSMLAPVLMTIFFLAFFRNFAQLGNQPFLSSTWIEKNQESVATYLRTTPNKL